MACCTNLRLVCVRLNADEQIQMVTALALQLIQCVVKLPSHISTEQYQSHDLDDVGSAKKKNDFVCLFLLFTYVYNQFMYWNCVTLSW